MPENLFNKNDHFVLRKSGKGFLVKIAFNKKRTILTGKWDLQPREVMESTKSIRYELLHDNYTFSHRLLALHNVTAPI